MKNQRTSEQIMSSFKCFHRDMLFGCALAVAHFVVDGVGATEGRRLMLVCLFRTRFGRAWNQLHNQPYVLLPKELRASICIKMKERFRQIFANLSIMLFMQPLVCYARDKTRPGRWLVYFCVWQPDQRYLLENIDCEALLSFMLLNKPWE